MKNSTGSKLILFLLIYFIGILILFWSFLGADLIKDLIRLVSKWMIIGIVITLVSFIIYYLSQNETAKDETNSFIFRRLIELFFISFLAFIFVSPLISNYNYKMNTHISYLDQTEENETIKVNLVNSGSGDIYELSIKEESSCSRGYINNINKSFIKKGEEFSINLQDIQNQPINYDMHSPSTTENLSWLEFESRFPSFKDSEEFNRYRNLCEFLGPDTTAYFYLKGYIQVPCYFILTFKSKNWVDSIQQSFRLNEERSVWIEGRMNETCDALKDDIKVKSYTLKFDFNLR